MAKRKRYLEPQFYQCPSPNDNLAKDVIWVKGLCDAGCARVIVYPANAIDKTPKVCTTCTEWLINIQGCS